MNIRNDFTVTKDQANTLNARIAAGEEYAELYGDINESRNEPTGEEAEADYRIDTDAKKG